MKLCGSAASSDLTEAKLQAERTRLAARGNRSAMNAKISGRGRVAGYRLQLEKEKLAIAEEARQAQLAANRRSRAGAALYELKGIRRIACRAPGSRDTRRNFCGCRPTISAVRIWRALRVRKVVARIHIPSRKPMKCGFIRRRIADADRKFSGR